MATPAAAAAAFGECAICMSDIAFADRYCMPCCGQRFHKVCARQWAATNPTCAACREPLERFSLNNSAAASILPRSMVAAAAAAAVPRPPLLAPSAAMPHIVLPPQAQQPPPPPQERLWGYSISRGVADRPFCEARVLRTSTSARWVTRMGESVPLCGNRATYRDFSEDAGGTWFCGVHDPDARHNRARRRHIEEARRARERDAAHRANQRRRDRQEAKRREEAKRLEDAERHRQENLRREAAVVSAAAAVDLVAERRVCDALRTFLASVSAPPQPSSSLGTQ